MSNTPSDSPAWIFVSHSSQDIEKVRRVRDAVENLGGRPLLFFLKCVTDDDELDGLLRREIEARRFFLLCDSANARAARWVQDEVNHVRSLQGKRVEVIDLDASWEAQLEGLAQLMRAATVFLSYARVDEAAVDVVARALRENDFGVWRDKDELQPVTNWERATTGAIDEALERGYVLAFLSAAAMQSSFVQSELEYALSLDATRVVPILLDPIDPFAGGLDSRLRERTCLDFVARDAGRFIPRLLAALGPSA